MGKGLLAAQVFSLFFLFPFLLKYNRLFYFVYIFLRLVRSFDKKWKVPAPLLSHPGICDCMAGAMEKCLNDE